MQRTTSFVLAAAVLLIGRASRADAPASPMEVFMGVGCPDVALDAALRQSLQARGAEAEAYFMQIATQGPSAEVLLAERNAAMALYQRRVAFSQRHKITRTTGQDTVETQANFVTRRMTDYRQRVTYRALHGLWVINTPQANAYLMSLAQDANSPWQLVAQELLASPR